MKFLIFLLFLSVLVLSSCRTTSPHHRVRKKASKIKKHAVKVNGESISANGVEVIREEVNPIVESNVDITEYNNTSNGITEDFDDNYTEKEYNNVTYWNSSSSDSEEKGEEINKNSGENIKKQSVAPKPAQKQVTVKPLKAKKESEETFTIAKSEMKETPFAVVDDSRFAHITNDTVSKTDKVLKQIKTQNLLGNNTEALTLLGSNWDLFVSSEKNSDSKEEYPLAEAYFLKGKINMDLAEKTADSDSAKEKYQVAMKSFYIVLSKYNARLCPFSSEAIKLFRKCRKKYFKLYQIKVGFPPEF